MTISDDQEDLIQEMIYQLWKSFENFNGKSQYSTWMYRVCLNTALTFFNKSTKVVKCISIQEDLNLPNEDKIEDDFQLQYLYKAIHQLTRVEKALIFLFLEGQSHKEIALNLGITEVNARVKLNRTKTKIQTIIKTYGYEF